MAALYGSGLYGVDLYGYAAPVATPPDTGGGSTGPIISIPPVNIGYGSGAYGDGPDGGAPADLPADNGYGAGLYGNGDYIGAHDAATTGYGAGLYGAGLYPGIIPADPPISPNPPAGSVTGAAWNVARYNQPTQLLGIGPWNPVKAWKGAPNYGIGKGIQPARPAMHLPATQSCGYTLRINAGCEATAELAFDRSKAIIIEEMSTDLWWRRKDPQTGLLEMMGRFNCSHNDITRSQDGTLGSSLQFQDYRILLGQRMVFKYLSGKPQATDSQWNTGTPITDIMRFAVPTDMGLDLSEIAATGGTDLGKTTTPYTLDPSSTIDQVFDNLLLISAKAWEWWVETPTDVTQAPKLRLIVGQRGRDRGVILFDYGLGATPIDSWQMRANADTYGNTLYFMGSEGGVVDGIPTQVTEYGERDQVYSDSTVNGEIVKLKAAAAKKLAEISDRRPSFAITLRNGFWKGRSHIDAGDTVHLKVRLGDEFMAYDYRVSEIDVSIDEVGTETVVLTLGTPFPSGDPRSRYSPLIKVIKTLKNYVVPDNSTTPTT